MNFNQLKRLADKCVFSAEGVTIIKTEEYDYLLKQTTQLTNNWNELEEWVKDNLGNCRTNIKYERGNEYIIKENVYYKVLNKMKEIKEKNNGN